MRGIERVQGWPGLAISTRKGKRFMIPGPDGKLIHFGQWPLKEGTFLDHGDKQRREAWYARHSANGLDDPYSPAYYSARILW